MNSTTTCETQVRVRYAETDAMGIAHHTSYIVWFELGRVELLRQTGHNYVDVERSGHYFAVSELNVRYLAPARFDDLITIRTRISKMRSRTMTFEYELTLTDSGRLLVSGSTRHVCLDRDGNVATIPASIRHAFS
mgnify:CR=1 FL=1